MSTTFYTLTINLTQPNLEHCFTNEVVVTAVSIDISSINLEGESVRQTVDLPSHIPQDSEVDFCTFVSAISDQSYPPSVRTTITWV